MRASGGHADRTTESLLNQRTNRGVIQNHSSDDMDQAAHEAGSPPCGGGGGLQRRPGVVRGGVSVTHLTSATHTLLRSKEQRSGDHT